MNFWSPSRARRAATGAALSVAFLSLSVTSAAADPRQVVVENPEPTVSCEGVTTDDSTIECHVVTNADGTVI